MRTIYQLLTALGACERSKNKYGKASRAFKKAFIEAYCNDADWFGFQIFMDYPFGYIGHKCNLAFSLNYPNLPHYQFAPGVHASEAAFLFRNKKNRIKYWPDVRRRLIELGVKL